MNPRRYHAGRLCCVSRCCCPPAWRRARPREDRDLISLSREPPPGRQNLPRPAPAPAEASLRPEQTHADEPVRAIVQTEGAADVLLNSSWPSVGARAASASAASGRRRRAARRRAGRVGRAAGVTVTSRRTGRSACSGTSPSTTGADAVAHAVELRRKIHARGTGVGIAVIDSGVSPSHDSFLDQSSASRVVADVNFTGSGSARERPLGHGTHVAALAAGTVGRRAPTRGLSPNVDIVNLRARSTRTA